MPNTWSHLRAAILLVVIAGSTLVASPVGPRITRKSLDRPGSRAEVEAWHSLAEPLGYSLEEFEEALIVWSDRIVTLDEKLTAPIKPVLRATKTGQAWGLFASPDDDPLRLQVHGLTANGEERLLFRRLDPEHDFLAGVFGFRRVRGIYDMGSRTRRLPPRYTNLARWVATRAIEAHPDLHTIVFTQFETHTTLPGQPPNPTVTEKHTVQFTRDELLGEAP